MCIRDRVNADCRAKGCTPSELQQRRIAVVGELAAARLQVLDEERLAWTLRVQTYFAQRAAVLSDESLSDASKRRNVQMLQHQSFSEEERLRLPAYEQMMDQPASP